MDAERERDFEAFYAREARDGDPLTRDAPLCRTWIFLDIRVRAYCSLSRQRQRIP